MTAKYNSAKLDSAKILKAMACKTMSINDVVDTGIVCQATIRKWLKQRYPSVEPKRAGRLAQALGVSAAEILAGADNGNSN